MIDRGWVIVLGVLLAVGLFNLGLALSVLRNRGRRRGILNGSLSDILNPWKQEKDDINELHTRVRSLQASNSEAPGHSDD
jgi:hypothetical protein